MRFSLSIIHKYPIKKITAQRKLLRHFNSLSMGFSVSNCVNLHAEYVQETPGSEENERYRYQIISNFF